MWIFLGALFGALAFGAGYLSKKFFTRGFSSIFDGLLDRAFGKVAEQFSFTGL